MYARRAQAYSQLICPLLNLLLLLIEVLRLPGYCSQVFGGLHVCGLPQRGLQQATQLSKQCFELLFKCLIGSQ